MIHKVRHYHIRLYSAVFIAFLYTGFYNADGILFQPIFHIPAATWLVALIIVVLYRRMSHEGRTIFRLFIGELQLSRRMKMALTFTLLFFTHIVVYAYFFQHAATFGAMYPYFCTATGLYAAFFSYMYNFTT